MSETSLKDAIDQNNKEQIDSIVEKITDHVTLIRVKPGDTLAVEIPCGLSYTSLERGHSVLRKNLPGGTQFFFYEKDSLGFMVQKTKVTEAGD